MNNFTFSVLCYNHEKYIIEHLESIRYLLKKFGANIDVSLIINDDSSIDKSKYLINSWLDNYSSLFKNVKLVFNDENIGTAKSTANIIRSCNTDYLKITAADDIYSFENIFLSLYNCKNYSIISGIPLNIKDGIMYNDRIDILSIIASKFIYRGKNKCKRFKLLSSNNAPNITYDLKCLKKNTLIKFLEEFNVVEDLPIQIAISEMENYNFFQDYKVYVYYRRTIGSTYMVKNNKFNYDRLKIFDYLLKKDNNYFEKILLLNRKYCFNIKNRYLKRLLNLSFYLFLIHFIMESPSILKNYFKIRLKETEHQRHYNYILENSINFFNNKC